jgi:hypothetical protein
MSKNEIKDFILMLLTRELEAEHRYRADSDQDTQYLKELLQAEQYILSLKKDAPTFVYNMMLKEDIEKYLQF